MVYELFGRNLEKKVLPYLHSRECVIIYGARQVGKTTLLKRLIQLHIRENVFYFDLEMRDLLELCNEGAEAVYAYLLQKGADEKKRIYLVIDEIQYLENPTNFIKIFHDHYEHVKLLLSGSSAFEMKKKFKQSLAGRIMAFDLYPLSFEEFLIFKGKQYRFKKENSKTINDELVLLAEEHIKFGGFPKIVLEKSEEKKSAYLSQLINTYVKRDIRDAGNIRNIDSFNKLLELLASQSGQLLNVSEVSNTLGINKATLLDYLGLLEHTFIIKLIRPFHKNLRNELTKHPKIFFIDTGMMHLLWLKEFPRIILGNVFETFVFLELMKTGKSVSFWRTMNKQEIDFIIPGKTLYAIEAKLNFSKSSNRHLDFFADTYACQKVTVGLYGEKNGTYIWELTTELRSHQ
jgi:uncharacterized protein